MVTAKSFVLSPNSSNILHDKTNLGNGLSEDRNLSQDQLLENRAYGIYNHYPPGIIMQSYIPN